MTIKQATPATGAAPYLRSNPNTKINPAKAPYQYRCLRALIDGPIDRRDLDHEIGTTNAPMFVRQLRLRGLVILLEKVSCLNRDGRKCWHGRYHLDICSRVKALDMAGE